MPILTNANRESSAINRNAIVRAGAIYSYLAGPRLVFAIAMFALGAAFSGIWAAYEARQTRFEDKRPFLAIEPRVGHSISSAPLKLHAYGKTPSKNVQILCLAARDGSAIDWKAANGLGEYTRNYLVPGEEIDFTCKLPKRTEYTYSYVLYGMASYTDLLGVGHGSPFCFVLSNIPMEATTEVQCPFSLLRGEPRLE